MARRHLELGPDRVDFIVQKDRIKLHFSLDMIFHRLLRCRGISR